MRDYTRCRWNWGDGADAGGKQVFRFAELPRTVTGLRNLPEVVLATPFQTAALVVAVLCRYGQDVAATIEMLNFLKGPQPLTNYDMQFMRDRLGGKEYLPFSYFAGASVTNNYTPTRPYTITVEENPYSYSEQNYAKLFIRSAGADSARPITLRRKGEQWFLWEHSLLPDIRKPVAEDPWA